MGRWFGGRARGPRSRSLAQSSGVVSYDFYDTFDTDFPDTHYDPAKWVNDWPGPPVTWSVTASELRMPYDENYPELYSADVLNMLGRQLVVEMTHLSAGVDRAVSFGWFTASPEGSFVAGGPSVQIGLTGEDSLVLAVAAAGVYSGTYNEVAHRWFRMREVGGETEFATSPDGATWTVRGSATNSGDFSGARLTFSAAWSGNSGPAPGESAYAAFGVVYVAPTS